ncbi:hypothetical protein [Erwinia sorbitola]|uniref:Uncharacterized protein n=1 Tax=Erwinia sorbitola TaxID=2681984 RepID=A0A6I6EDD0_9GAMM|nr:hypothetical protein [Erwinia sorbitola]MTD28124.1 hypothetical protein [Erwinia sorbitola]QGU85815.1 hypothetical protein GN242_00630 [Erwinia sorbitola]
MSQLVKLAAVLAAFCLTPLTQAAVVSHPQMSAHTNNGQGSPFGYERQLKKMMRPINDLLPQGGNDEAQRVREQ